MFSTEADTNGPNVLSILLPWDFNFNGIITLLSRTIYNWIVLSQLPPSTTKYSEVGFRATCFGSILSNPIPLHSTDRENFSFCFTKRHNRMYSKCCCTVCILYRVLPSLIWPATYLYNHTLMYMIPYVEVQRMSHGSYLSAYYLPVLNFSTSSLYECIFCSAFLPVCLFCGK